jgi:hypothetical protein
LSLATSSGEHRPVAEPAARVARGRGLGEALRSNGLSLVVGALFLLFLVGQSVAGWIEHNQSAREHGQQVVSFLPYLLTGHFWEATVENWESEFLAVLSLVVLSIWLRAKGSPESKPVAAPHRQTGSE